MDAAIYSSFTGLPLPRIIERYAKPRPKVLTLNFRVPRLMLRHEARDSSKVGRVVTSTVLTAVSGGLAQDAARNAAETALNNRDADDSAAGGDALLLDTGAEMDVLVTKPF